MNPLDILKYGHLTFHNTVDDLADEDWETGGVCGWWSTKDIASHLVSFEYMLEDILKGFTSGGETPTLNRMFEVGAEKFNDIEVGQRKDMTGREVMADFDETYSRVVKLAKQIPPEKWRENGTLPWYGMEYSLDDYIVYTFYAHKREHAAQIGVFKDALKQA
jgi:hypothetical protein